MWACIPASVVPAAVFLVLNMGVLLLVLSLNRRAESWPISRGQLSAPSPGTGALDASSVLGWEYDYARATASEAMSDRHTMVNFYLLAAGIVGSGLLAALRGETAAPKIVGTVFLWLLCCVGWFFFLNLIRLRQAWHDSARVMNEIKSFYINHSKQFPPEMLQRAFLWRTDTLPAPDKPWTLFFNSAMLVGFLDTVSFVGGGVFLALSGSPTCLLVAVSGLGFLGLVFLAFHVWLYFAFLGK